MMQSIEAIRKTPSFKKATGLNGKDKMKIAIDRCLELIKSGVVEIAMLAKRLGATIYTTRGYLVKLKGRGLIEYKKGQVGGNGRKPIIILI